MLETTLKSRLSEFVPSWRNIASDIKLTGVPRLLFLRSEVRSPTILIHLKY